MIEIVKISSPHELKKSHAIRLTVFVDEQHVSIEEEMDEFEDSSLHYLAYFNKIPAGTARWRFTEKGIKLERFAVIKEYRNKGIGSKLMQFILNEIKKYPGTNGKEIYLHAQLNAMSLYSKFGFNKTGNMFEEAGIKHFKMIKFK